MNRAKIGLVLKRTFYFSILCTILFLGKCASEISEIRKIKKNNDIYYVVFGLKVGNNIPPIVMYEPTTQQPQPYEELPKTFDELAETVAVNINRYWDKKTNILENITLLEKGILIGMPFKFGIIPHPHVSFEKLESRHVEIKRHAAQPAGVMIFDEFKIA